MGIGAPDFNRIDMEVIGARGGTGDDDSVLIVGRALGILLNGAALLVSFGPRSVPLSRRVCCAAHARLPSAHQVQ